jgi:hypothetical protein
MTGWGKMWGEECGVEFKWLIRGEIGRNPVEFEG